MNSLFFSFLFFDKQVIKSTGMYSGLELHMFVEPPYYDERLPEREDRLDLKFSEKRIEVDSDEQWQDVVREQPWSISKRRRTLTAFLQAKMEADDGDLAEEGCHGMWEFSINRDNHADVRLERLMPLLYKIESSNNRIATTAAAALWGLAPSASCRRSLAELDTVSSIIRNIKRSLMTPGQKSTVDRSGAAVIEGKTKG